MREERGTEMASGTQISIPRVILRVGQMDVCAERWFSTSGKLYRPNIDCVIAEAFYFILESVLCPLHVWQMIPKDSEQRLEVDHRTVLWLLYTWLVVDLTSEGHSVTMRSSKHWNAS
jgi:hypothetical protein